MNELQEQYRLLDVTADVSLSTLKQAYKDLVLVWHPDRFSDHPRLQKKAEEKLKCINLAYQELSALHRQERTQQIRDTDAAHASPHRHHRQSYPSPGTHHSQERDPSKQETQQQSRCSTENCHSDISMDQAHFIVSHFHFRAIQRSKRDCKSFKSGPFRLEFNDREQKVLLENLCDSINGFHPILLKIPCKASRLFSGAEAQKLMALFQESQSG